MMHGTPAELLSSLLQVLVKRYPKDGPVLMLELRQWLSSHQTDPLFPTIEHLQPLLSEAERAHIGRDELQIIMSALKRYEHQARH